jgi:hypothetical protein
MPPKQMRMDPMIPVVRSVVAITLVSTAHAFLQPHVMSYRPSTSLLDKPNIEVVSQPDPEFLEKQG